MAALFCLWSHLYGRRSRARPDSIVYTMPVWASILGAFILGERLTFARVIGLFLGLAGLLILIGPDIKAVGSAPLGAIFMLGAAINWAIGTVFLKYFRWTMPITVLAGWQLVFGGIPVIIGAFIPGADDGPLARVLAGRFGYGLRYFDREYLLLLGMD